MAASLTETLTLSRGMDSSPLRLKPLASPPAQSRLYRPSQAGNDSSRSVADSRPARTGSGSKVRLDPQRALQPARKKLSTLEAQRVMAALATAIRRCELVSLLPGLVAMQRDADAERSVALGADLVRLLAEYGALMDSHDQLKTAERKCQSRAGSAASTGRQVPVITVRDEDAPSEQDSADAAKERPPSRSQTPSRGEEVSRNLGLVERRMSESVRNVLRAFAQNPSAAETILTDSTLGQLRSDSAQEMIEQLKALRDFVMSRLLTTPIENIERARYLREIAEKERYNAGVIAKLTAELTAAEELRDTDIAKQNDVIRRLQAELHQIERVTDENVARMRIEAEKQEAADRKNSESKLAKLQQDLAHVRTQYSNLLTQHRESEAALRKRKFQIETEVENWIQKYDGDMGERQDEYEQIDAVYTEEKRQLNELEERFKALQGEYDRIMDERRVARETREAAERELQTCIRAALTIQAFWRSFKVRKAIKGKKKKGGNKGAGQKKGKK